MLIGNNFLSGEREKLATKLASTLHRNEGRFITEWEWGGTGLRGARCAVFFYPTTGGR